MLNYYNLLNANILRIFYSLMLITQIFSRLCRDPDLSGKYDYTPACRQAGIVSSGTNLCNPILTNYCLDLKSKSAARDISLS